MSSRDEPVRRAGETGGPTSRPSSLRHALLVARREGRMLRRSRGAVAAVAVLFGAAWLPTLLAAARSGSLGSVPFGEVSPVALAFGGVILPLLGLLAGADVLAGELEDRTLLPLLTASISRTACYAGKLAGTATVLGVVYIAAYGSAGGFIAMTHGTAGAGEYLAVAVAGLALMLSSLALGTLLAAGGGGRVRAYALALVAWMVLVIALDALLLSVVIVSAPAPPADVGGHGHDELMATTAQAPPEGNYPWFLLLDPVDLYRLTVLQTGPGLRASWLAGGAAPAGRGARAASWLAWLFWLIVPAAVGAWRFRRVALV